LTCPIIELCYFRLWYAI